MANNCNYEMLLRGKKKDVLLFAKWLGKQETEPDEHPLHRIGFRIAEAEFDDADLEGEDIDDTVELTVTGYCAWAVAMCMLEGSFTYHDRWKNFRDSLSVPEACAELDVTCEVFGWEELNGWAEHFLVDSDGTVEFLDSTKYELLYIGYDAYEDMLDKDPDTDVTKDEFEEARDNHESYLVHCDWLPRNSFKWPFVLA